MATKKKVTTTKVKKKKWYPILASKNFNEQLLGESYVSDPEQLSNKFVNINLSTLTGNFRDQNLNLTFKVYSIVESKARTVLIRYTMLPSFLKRFVRRDKSKVTDSFIVKDKTGKRIRVKPLIITHNLAAKSQQTQLRKLVKDFTKKYLQKITFDDFIAELMKKMFQKNLRNVLKKVTPIKFAEIRSTYYETEKFNKKVTINEEPEEVPILEVKEEKVVPEEVKEVKETKEIKEEVKQEVKETKEVKEVREETVVPKETKEVKEEKPKEKEEVKEAKETNEKDTKN